MHTSSILVRVFESSYLSENIWFFSLLLILTLIEISSESAMKEIY